MMVIQRIRCFIMFIRQNINIMNEQDVCDHSLQMIIQKYINSYTGKHNCRPSRLLIKKYILLVDKITDISNEMGDIRHQNLQMVGLKLNKFE